MTDKTVSVTLASPVELNGETFSTLTFREPDVGDLVRAEELAGPEAGQQTTICALLAAMSGMPWDAFHKIKVRDLKRIMGETKDFLDGVGDPPASDPGETSQS